MIPVAKIPSASKMILSFMALISLLLSRENSRRRMILRVANDRDAAAVGSYHVTFRHGVFRVIGALCVNVRLQREQQLFNRRFVKNCDIGNRLTNRRLKSC